MSDSGVVCREAAEKTIFALASARGRAGVAVMRISGSRAGEVLQTLSGRKPPPPREARLVKLRHPDTGDLLDEALCLYFKAPASFTGEDVVELHLHGGRAVLTAVTEALAAFESVEPAEPGAFSRRAFEHGKLDLTAAEGINDLVMAETAAQRSLALRQMGGMLSTLYEDWRARLIETLALIEADIDFPDEDLPEGVAAGAMPALEAIHKEVAAHLSDNRRGERLRDGVSIVILGPPNVGKSSLLNAIARRDVAIVSDIAGTTRDVIEVSLDLGGYPATLIDTAGLREAGDSIEAEGVRRALERARHADLKLVLASALDWPTLPKNTQGLLDDASILVLNKIDDVPQMKAGRQGGEIPAFALSATTEAGVGILLNELEDRVVEMCNAGEAPILTRARHRAALEDCRDCLDRFFRIKDEDSVLAAEDIRLAARALGRITGRVDVEEILDVVFSSFCIGK